MIVNIYVTKDINNTPRILHRRGVSQQNWFSWSWQIQSRVISLGIIFKLRFLFFTIHLKNRIVEGKINWHSILCSCFMEYWPIWYVLSMSQNPVSQRLNRTLNTFYSLPLSTSIAQPFLLLLLLLWIVIKLTSIWTFFYKNKTHINIQSLTTFRIIFFSSLYSVITFYHQSPGHFLLTGKLSYFITTNPQQWHVETALNTNPNLL